MKEPDLEVTFRRGVMLAAYYYFPRDSDERSVRCERVEPGFVIDFDAEDCPIGIELIAPGRITVNDLNRLLARLGQAGIDARDLAPLQVA